TGNIILNAEKEPGYEELDTVHQEKWRLYKTYNEFATGTWHGKKPFRPERFFRDFSKITDDKSGHNAAIYIIAWCLQISCGNPVELTGKGEAFKKYRDRYLKQEYHQRVNIFMNLMQIADRLDYDYEKVCQKTAEVFETLKATPTPEYTGNLEGLEIIPLEKLWEMVLKAMKINRPKSSKNI